MCKCVARYLASQERQHPWDYGMIVTPSGLVTKEVIDCTAHMYNVRHRQDVYEFAQLVHVHSVQLNSV